MPNEGKRLEKGRDNVQSSRRVGPGVPPLRHCLYLDLGLTRESLAQMYVECGTFDALATKIGVTRQTVQKWFRRLGIRGTSNKPHAVKPENRNAMSRWIRANPGKELPRSVTKAAKLIGISPNTFEACIERRRERVRAYVTSLGKLSDFPHTLRDDSGRYVPPKAIATAAVRVERWTLAVTYEGTLKVGTPFTLTMPYAKVVKMWKESRDARNA